MFYIDFFNSVSLGFYFVFAFLFFMFSLTIGLRYITGPTAISAINFLAASSLALIYAKGLDVYILVASIFVFFITYGFFCRTNIIFKKSTRINYFANDFHNEKKYEVIFFVILFLMVNIVIFLKFSDGGRVNKLTWTVSAGILPYINSALLMIVYCCFLHCLEREWTILGFCILVLIGLAGYIFSSKGILINAFLLYLIYKTRGGLKAKYFFILFLVACFFIFIVSNIYFGAGVYGLLALISRLIATIDGTFSIFFDGMYGVYILDKPVLYYYLDFLTSRIYGVTEGLGQIIAHYSRIDYPEFGGPNDSVVNYLLLSDGLDKATYLVTVFFLSVFGSVLERLVRSPSAKHLSLIKKIIVYPIYLSIPMIYQGVGTGFLELARVYVVLVPTIFCYFLLRVFYGK